MSDDRTSWQSRLAGAVLIAIALINAALFAIAAGADAMPVAALVGAVFAVAVLLVFGVLIWRGSRPAAIVALTLVGASVIVQVGRLFDQPERADVVRLVVTVVVAALLVLAVVQPRRSA